jgi:hypothetical protein
MKRLHRFYATGLGQFPSDMLRYDQGKVLDTFKLDQFERNTFYLIESNFITHGRWKSFLWAVIETKEQCDRFGLDYERLGKAVQQ